MVFRKIVLALFSLSTIAQPATAERYIFRYKTAIYDSIESPGASEDFDIMARYQSMVGFPFEATIPVKPGVAVSQWVVGAGSLPEGITLDSNTGVLSGTLVNSGTSKILLTGYGNYQISKALVTFEVLADNSLAKKYDIYAHADRSFSARISASNETVHAWTPVTPLPTWASVSSSIITGTPPAGSEGVYAFALSGKNFYGEEIAFSYGNITVEQGPTIAFVPDAVRHPRDQINVVGKVSKRMGELAWSLEGDPLPANLGFSKRDGYIRGRIDTFSTTATVRFVARDIDGTVGYSNWFQVGTSDPDLELKNVANKDLVLGEFASFGFAAADLSGTATWSLKQGTLPEGMEIDPATGKISGTPTRIERQTGIIVAVSTSDGTSDESNPFTIEVFPAAIKIGTKALHVRKDTPFATDAPTVTGTTSPWSFELADGQTLYPGFAFDSATGVISGSSSEVGNKSVSFVVKDGERTSKAATAGINIYEPLSVSVSPSNYILPRMTQIIPVTTTVAENSFIPSERNQFGTFTLTGTLPAGLQFNSAGGTISGMPTAEGTYGPYTIAVQDGSGSTAISNTFAIEVGPRLPIAANATDLTVYAHKSNNASLATAENAVGEVTWALKAGVLPSGLNLRSDGRLTGSTALIGTYDGIVLTASDAEGQTSDTPPFKLVVAPPQSISFDTEMNWSVGRSINKQLAAANAIAPVSWSVQASTPLPSGLALSADGGLTGTPATIGLTAVKLNITDGLGRVATGDLKLNIVPAMTMSFAANHALTRGTQVSLLPTIINGIGKVQFDAVGTLPPGMLFSPSDGSISGAPASVGTWNDIKVSAIDEAGTSRSAVFSISVNEGGKLQVEYDFTAPLIVHSSTGLPKFPKAPTGGVGEVSFKISGALPNGLNFNTTSGAITGIPTEIGVFSNIIVTVEDSEGTKASSSSLTIIVAAAGQLSLSDQTRQARAGAYFATAPVVPTNAVSPLTFSLRSPRPAEVTLITATGELTGTAGDEGSRLLAMSVKDAAGKSKDFNLSLEYLGPLAISYANAMLNQYNPASVVSPTSSNIIEPASFTLAAGALPQGMSLDTNTGEIKGTPATTGTFGGIRIAVSDSSTSGNTATSAPFTITVGARLPLSVEVSADNIVVANKPYSLTPVAVNSVGAVTWSVSGGLPTGLSLDPQTGKIFGTATAVGEWSVSLKATDSLGASFTAPLTFTAMTDGLPIKLTTYSVKVKSGKAFVSDLPKVRNAVGDISFHSNDLALYGLSLDPKTGEISGTVNEATKITANLFVTDSSNRVTSEPIVVDVIPNIRITVREGIDVTVNAAMNSVYPVTDYALGAVKYELIGAKPNGIVFSPSSGGITGTPAQLGVFEDLYIKATDSTGDTVISSPFRITVHESGVIPTVSINTNSVLTAGATSAAFQATWSPKKTDDTFSLNKPLPQGLALDDKTGKISGIPQAGTQGLHEGYILTVTDTAGKSGISSPFVIKIKAQNTNTFKSQVVKVRANQPFESSPPAYDPATVVGNLSFSKSSGFVTGTYLDSETGVVSGKISSNKTFYVTPTDGISSHTNFNVAVEVSSPTISVPNQVFETGTEIISEAPKLDNIVGTPRFTLTAGSIPPGLQFDTATGQFYGIMPEGLFSSLRITVADDFGSTLSSNFSLTGNDTRPDNFVIADVSNVNPNTTVYSSTTAMKLTGFTTYADVSISTSNGSGGIHICTTATTCNSSTNEPNTTRIHPNNFLKVFVKSGAYGETVTATITVGGVQSIWKIKTREYDITPDDFEFPEVTGAARGETVTSESIQITGLADPTTVSVSGPAGTMFRRDTTRASGNYINQSTSSNFQNNWYLQVRTVAPDAYDAVGEVFITVGDKTVKWTLKTHSRAVEPAPISFVNQVDVARNTNRQSNAVLITGITEGVDVTMSGNSSLMQWRDCTSVAASNCSAWQSQGSTRKVENGRYLQLQMKPSAEFETEVSMSVQVGTTSASWAVKTRSYDTTPDDFSFTDVTDAAPGAAITQTVKLTGIPDPVDMSIVGPQGTKVNRTTGGSGTIGNIGASGVWGPEQFAEVTTFTLTIYASAVPGETKTLTLTVGDTSRTWNVTTRP